MKLLALHHSDSDIITITIKPDEEVPSSEDMERLAELLGFEVEYDDCCDGRLWFDTGFDYTSPEGHKG